MSGLKISQIHAFISVDPEDGNEGIISITTKEFGTMPLICADAKRVASLRPIAKRIAQEQNIIVKLIRFDGERKELEQYGTS